MKDHEILRRAWNCNMRLKKAVKFCGERNISKDQVVKFYKSTCKAVGYSGSIAIPRAAASMHRAFSYQPSEEISPGLHYCEQRQLWWKNGTTYDRRGAEHNGLIGAGAQLRQIIKGARNG